MAQYRLMYVYPHLDWDHDNDYRWFERMATHTFEALNEKEARHKADVFLKGHSEWGLYKKGKRMLPFDGKLSKDVLGDTKLVNQPISLTKIVKIWKE